MNRPKVVILIDDCTLSIGHPRYDDPVIQAGARFVVMGQRVGFSGSAVLTLRPLAKDWPRTWPPSVVLPRRLLRWEAEKDQPTKESR